VADISIVVPTRNEGVNVRILVAQLLPELADGRRSWELIFVDDSDGASPQIIGDLCRTWPQVRLLHRSPRRRHGGLAAADATGMGAAHGRTVVVMHGDLQHPPALAVELAELVLRGHYEVAIASRYVRGASSEGQPSWRRFAARVGVALAHIAVPRTRGIRDPLSGFFAIAGATVRGLRLRARGSSILMDLLARRRADRVVELPFQVARRSAGASKARAGDLRLFLSNLGRMAAAEIREDLPSLGWVAG
jgi:dolichol-phosphate mannosyltransferase